MFHVHLWSRKTATMIHLALFLVTKCISMELEHLVLSCFPLLSFLQKISIPRPENPSELRTFTFYLSNVGRDNPQGSFDCIQQFITR